MLRDLIIIFLFFVVLCHFGVNSNEYDSGKYFKTEYFGENALQDGPDHVHHLYGGYKDKSEKEQVLVEKLVWEMAEAFRLLMVEGDRDLGIPILDPLDLPNFAEHIHEYLVDLYVKGSGLTLSGLATFLVENMEVVSRDSEGITARLRFVIPNCRIDGQKYSVKGKLMGIYNMDVAGKFKMIINGLKGDALMKVYWKKEGIVQIKDTNLFMSYDHIDMKLENANKFLVYAVRKRMPAIIDGKFKKLSILIKEYEKEINKLLEAIQ